MDATGQLRVNKVWTGDLLTLPLNLPENPDGGNHWFKRAGIATTKERVKRGLAVRAFFVAQLARTTLAPRQTAECQRRVDKFPPALFFFHVFQLCYISALMPGPYDRESMDTAFDAGIRGIGEVVYYFQQLEEELGAIVAFLIAPEHDSIGEVVVPELSFKQRASLAYSLFARYIEAKQGSNLKDWTAILSKAHAAEQKRNTLLHSTFGVSWGSDESFLQRTKRTAKFKKGLQETAEALDSGTMQNCRAAMSDVTMELWEFMSKVFPGWRDRSWNRD